MGDMAIVVDRTSDREGLQILRRRSEDSPVEVGTLRPLRDGKPVDGEIISLRPRKDFPFVCNVKVEVPDQRRLIGDGPAQISTRRFRKGWEAIWGNASPDVRSAKPN